MRIVRKRIFRIRKRGEVLHDRHLPVGIVEGENLTVEEGNAAADAGTARQISDGFVSDGVDLICAIATPSAEAAYVSAMNTDIPVVYTAVTDPVTAKLADEDGTPVGNVTGTSDELP